MTGLSDNELLDQDPRASMAIEHGLCGGGKPQPGWDACGRAGAWRVRMPSGGDYAHDYCTEHAAARIRAADRLMRHTGAVKRGILQLHGRTAS